LRALKIGFVGLGAMGQAIVSRIIQAGHSVTVHDLSAQAVNAMVEKGATALEQGVPLGSDKNLVFVSVSHADIMEKLICEEGGLLDGMDEGGIIVDLGTTPSGQCRQLAKLASAKGKVFLDAPVSGSTPWADAGTLAMMVGGEEQSYQRVRPILSSFANKIHYLGGSGNGQLLKLCHQLTFVSTITGISEAIALAEAHGLKAKMVLDVLAECVAPRYVIDFMLPMAENERFDQGRGTLKLGHKDLQAVKQSAEDVSLKLPLAEELLGYMDKAMQEGWQDADLFALVDMARDEFYATMKSS
jgi:3-hydroxyisobutyrate dehydrogenase-like beta-hydroxyacid dehydrogenase